MNEAIDTYSMLDWYELQDEFLDNPDDRLEVLEFVSKHLFSLVKTLTTEDFRHFNAHRCCSLVLHCCDDITELKLDKIDRRKRGE